MSRRGFTLVELLISIVLMVILLSAVTLIFLRTTETVAIAEARQHVYTSARYALDIMENDVMGCLPFSSGIQRFIMENGATAGPPAASPSYGGAGNHTPGGPGNAPPGAADRIIFRCTTMVGDTLQTAEVTYELIPGNQAIGPGGTLVAGNPEHGRTVRTNRPMYTLVRRVRVMAPNQPNPNQPWTNMPQDAAGNPINDMEICHFVVSFNLEYYANNQTFSNLQPSYFTPTDPLGDGQGVNDTPGGNVGGTPTPLRVPALRATLVIIDDVGERQERVIPKEIWIPMG